MRTSTHSRPAPGPLRRRTPPRRPRHPRALPHRRSRGLMAASRTAVAARAQQPRKRSPPTSARTRGQARFPGRWRRPRAKPPRHPSRRRHPARRPRDHNRRAPGPLAAGMAAAFDPHLSPVAWHPSAASISGSRIIKRDIEAAGAGAAKGVQAGATPPRGDAEFRDIPLTQIRKTIARRLAESIGPIPTFYLTAEYDLDRLSELRTAMAEMGDEYKVSFNDLIMKAVATALVQHPECNAHWLGDRIREFDRVHLGMAVATDDGLIVPVIFDADTKGLRQIAAESRELAKRARERKLKPEEYTGSTFSVSNLGMFGIDQFTAIINPPEAGILAIGSVEQKPVVVGDELEIHSRLRVTMSCDHRVIDGAIGARFLQTLRRMLENPLMLIY